MTKIYSSEQLEKLSEALSKAQGQLKHATKAVENSFFKSSYADLAAIYDASRQALADNGLSVTQITDVDDIGAITLITTLLHSSGQWMRSWYPVRPIKTDPQGLGSALTYARRYSYSAIIGVAAIGEDDDGNSSSGPTTGELSAKGVYGSAKAMKDKFKEISEAMNNAGTTDDLDDLKERYRPDFANFKSIDTHLYDNLVQIGAQRRKVIEDFEVEKEAVREANAT